MASTEALKELLEKGKHIIYTTTNHVSRSGMSRSISCFIATEAGGITNITGRICMALDKKRDSYNGITVHGCGMDMGHALVYALSRKLYCPDEYNHNAAYKLTHRCL